MYKRLPRSTVTPVRAAAILATVFSLAFATPSLIAAVAPAQTIEITKFAYSSKEITVAPGTKITWINRDEIPHTVTAKDKSFDSKALDTSDKFERTFDKEGDFDYYCSVHPFMTGIVHVRKQ